jgi:hypothetical protein
VLDRLLDVLVVLGLRAGLARSASAPAWFRAASDPQQEVRHVMADGGFHLCTQQKRLSDDALHRSVEIGEQEPGKLKPRLIDDITVFGCRLVGPGVVPLAFVPSERSPWRCRGEHLSGRQFPRQGNLRPVGGTPDGDPHRLNRARHVGTSSWAPPINCWHPDSHGESCCPRISPGVSQLICTSAARVQASLRKCGLK